MGSRFHTYGPSCRLQRSSLGSNLSPQRHSTFSDEKSPKINIQFFYSSNSPIDNPIAIVPTSTTPPRIYLPFSAHDNGRLEEAWQKYKGIGGDDGSGNELRRSGNPMILQQPALAQTSSTGRSKDDISALQDLKLGRDGKRVETRAENAGVFDDIPGEKSRFRRQTLGSRVKNMEMKEDHGVRSTLPFRSRKLGLELQSPRDIRSSSPKKAESERPGQEQGDPSPDFVATEMGNTQQKHNEEIRREFDPSPNTAVEEYDVDPTDLTSDGREHGRDAMSLLNNSGLESKPSQPTPPQTPSLPPKSAGSTSLRFSGSFKQEPQYGSSPAERDTTGNPFQRAVSPRRRFVSPQRPTEKPKDMTDISVIGSADEDSRRSSGTSSSSGSRVAAISEPVGLSRLHVVDIATFEMKPIYWSSANDVSHVHRGTWFYKGTLLPVETELANRLEAGYQYMRPWTQTYTDELNSCLEIGPEAELKVVYEIFQTPRKNPKRKNNDRVKPKVQIEDMAVGYLDSDMDSETIAQLYQNCSVIYADGTDAQILRATQLPSVSRGRKPLGPIRKGKRVGIPVIRGFDHQAWDRLHPVKGIESSKLAHDAAVKARSDTNAIGESEVCQACLPPQEFSKATDLVLVIHGIGQKLSERVDSFRFTHAVNNLRREVALTREHAGIQPLLREDLGGIMVLPVNWRGIFNPEGERENSRFQTSGNIYVDPPKDFTLSDVTGPSIPAVRDLINDVMLDIPYFMSKHKQNMVQAMIGEANRIYRLWCRHNPGFHDNGRVHLVAHSLGSVMALDALSMQPTHLPLDQRIDEGKASRDSFEFDTKSVFFCGSPVGFFLHLERAKLSPRGGRRKPGAESITTISDLNGGRGEFGCMAVDNVYNIIHPNDPVAYRLNPCIDVNYANSLKPASIPSLTPGWFQYIFRTKPPSLNRQAQAPDTISRPMVSKLPSTVEMEVHNFSLEEIAENRMYLINDNGQVDWFLPSRGGLEFQYLNMLSAHSSYWTSPDFIRFLVVEVGRAAGGHETIPSFRAEKVIRWKKGDTKSR